ncbi:replication-relaxation family protein [Glycomyces buryatensis]|nr:replication-relaxation family protein [Glycomyces buryatensis]
MTATVAKDAIAFTDLYQRLTDRDLAIIDCLGSHQILTTPMLADVFFPSEWTARDRILTLNRLGVLARFRPTNRSAYRYTLGEWGHAIWAHRNAAKPPTKQWCAWHVQKLAVSRTRIHLETANGIACRLHADAQANGAFTVVQWLCETEAAAACSGQLHPDAGWVVKWRTGPQLRAWHEHDQGTETHTQLAAKLRRYMRYRPLDGGRSRTLLFTLPSAARESNFHTTARREPLEFPVATAITAQAARHPAGQHWRLIGSGRRLSLAEIAHRAEQT